MNSVPSLNKRECYLCGSEGRLLYEDLHDRIFETPGSWCFRLCSNTQCALIWLDPLPGEESIGMAYAKYYTHGDGKGQVHRCGRIVRILESWISSIATPDRNHRKRLAFMYLGEHPPGRLLDVGCGSGARLAQFRSLGWEVIGQDVDPQAAKYARETLGLDVRLGQLKDIHFPDSFFDCITLNHVIEHAHDPLRLLMECRRILKKGGILVLVTPNSLSFAHSHFGPFWRGLEPPRHIHLFCPNNLLTLAARSGLSLRSAWTTTANARTFALASLSAKGGWLAGSNVVSKALRHVQALSFVYRSTFELARNKDSGEECVIQLTT